MTVQGGNTGNRLLLGIDLGTSRTVVMSDHGYKNIIRSVVGYPKDIIGVKMLGKTQIFGDEALQRRSALTLYYPLRDGVIRETGDGDYNAAAELIRHVVELARQGEARDACGIVGVPARASIVNKELLITVASDVLSSVMVVSEPFMVAYALGVFNNAIVVDIGGGTVDICGMKGTVPAADDQVTLLKGGNFLDERLQAAISQQYPETQVTRNLARLIKEKYAFVGATEEPVRVTLRAEGRPRLYDVTEEVRAVCEAIVPEIAEHLAAIFRSYDPEDQPDVLQNIILAGGGSRIRGLDVMLAERLREYGKARVTCVDDPDFIGCSGALKMAQEVPPEFWDQVGFVGGH